LIVCTFAAFVAVAHQPLCSFCI